MGALVRVDGQCHHEGTQGVGRVRHVDDVGIGPVEELLADGGHQALGGTDNGVVPLGPVPLDLPVAAIKGVAGGEEGELPLQAP